MERVPRLFPEQIIQTNKCDGCWLQKALSAKVEIRPHEAKRKSSNPYLQWHSLLLSIFQTLQNTHPRRETPQTIWEEPCGLYIKLSL